MYHQWVSPIQATRCPAACKGLSRIRLQYYIGRYLSVSPPIPTLASRVYLKLLKIAFSIFNDYVHLCIIAL